MIDNKNYFDPSIKHFYLNPSQSLNLPAKINIHYCIPKVLLDSIKILNQRILKISLGEIDYSLKTIQIPHITVYMGFCESYSNYISILESTSNFVEKLYPIEVSISKPYLKTDRKNWVFCDILPIAHILDIKKDFSNQYSNLFEPLNWDVVSEPPHITIAYIKTNHDLVENVLIEWNGPEKVILDKIGISFGGARGSCIGHIKIFDLGN